jgi:copper chaperone CopZ
VAVTYSVTGMTCGHCEKAVAEEVSALPGVTVVDVDAKTGLLTVESEGALDNEAVRAAVNEAGYQLAGRTTS